MWVEPLFLFWVLLFERCMTHCILNHERYVLSQGRALWVPGPDWLLETVSLKYDPHRFLVCKLTFQLISFLVWENIEEQYISVSYFLKFLFVCRTDEHNSTSNKFIQLLFGIILKNSINKSMFRIYSNNFSSFEYQDSKTSLSTINRQQLIKQQSVEITHSFNFNQTIFEYPPFFLFCVPIFNHKFKINQQKIENQKYCKKFPFLSCKSTLSTLNRQVLIKLQLLIQYTHFFEKHHFLFFIETVFLCCITSTNRTTL